MNFFVPSDGGAAGQLELPAEAARDAGTPEKLSRRERVGLIILFATAGLLLFGTLGSRQLWKSEARWGAVAREMLLTGNYFRPTINGVDYFDKPLVGYWLVVLAAKVCGGVNEWAVRLPSALAGVVALAATVGLGRRLWSARVAITAGWMLLTSYGFLFYARLGMADMENAAAIMLALAWYWRIAGRQLVLRSFGPSPSPSEEAGHPASGPSPDPGTPLLDYAKREPPSVAFLPAARCWEYAVFYAICAVGAQTKGLTAILVPMAAVLPDLVRGGRWRRHLNPAHALGAAVGAAVYLAPFLAWHEGLRKVWEENFQRATDPFDHDEEPVYAYLYYVPILLMPWSPVLVLAVGWIVRRWKQTSEQTRWLVLAMAMIFAFFTASASRRSYYILPILPPAALLCAVSVWAPGTARKRAIVQGAWWVAVGAGVMEVLGPVGALAVKWKYGVGLPPVLVWGTPVIGLMVLGVMVGRRLSTRFSRAGEACAPPHCEALHARRPPLAPPLRRGGKAWGRRWTRWLALYAGLGPTVVAAAVIFGGFFLVQYPAMDFVGGYREFARELRARLAGAPGTVPVGVYKEAPDGFVFYMNEPRPMRRILTSEQLAEFLGAGTEPRAVVVRKRFLGRLRDLGMPAERMKKPEVKQEMMPWDAQDDDGCLWAFVVSGTTGTHAGPER